MPSVSIFKKHLDRQWSEILPTYIDNFLYSVIPGYLCFPLSPIPDQLMWLVLAFVGYRVTTKTEKLSRKGNINYVGAAETILGH